MLLHTRINFIFTSEILLFAKVIISVVVYDWNSVWIIYLHVHVHDVSSGTWLSRPDRCAVWTRPRIVWPWGMGTAVVAAYLTHHLERRSAVQVGDRKLRHNHVPREKSGKMYEKSYLDRLFHWPCHKKYSDTATCMISHAFDHLMSLLFWGFKMFCY